MAFKVMGVKSANLELDHLGKVAYSGAYPFTFWQHIKA